MHRRTALAPVLAAVLLAGCSAGSDSVAVGDPSAVPGLSPAAAPEPSAVPSVTPSVRTIDVAFAGGAVTGTDGREEVAVGEQVVLRFTSDVAEEIHVHGYDEYVDLVPGTPAEVALTASIPGVFEVELHDAGKTLYQLRVA